MTSKTDTNPPKSVLLRSPILTGFFNSLKHLLVGSHLKNIYIKVLSHFHSGRWSVLHLLYFSLPTQCWRKQTIPTHALHLMVLKFKLFTTCTCVTSRLLSLEVILISGFNTGGDLFRRLACLGFLHRLEKNYKL